MHEPCRCGYTGEGPHPCRGKEYRCKKPATSRFVAQPTCLAGAQMKLQAYETWACDECWAEFQEALKKVSPSL